MHERIHQFSAAKTRAAYRAELMMGALDDSADRRAVLVRFAESVTPEEAKLLRQVSDDADGSRATRKRR